MRRRSLPRRGLHVQSLGSFDLHLHLLVVRILGTCTGSGGGVADRSDGVVERVADVRSRRREGEGVVGRRVVDEDQG